MADSLVLTGVKDVKKHTGDEMRLTRPKRGGDTHQIKEWWKGRGGKQYVSATIFDVTVGGNSVKLALDTNSGTNIRIDHDGAFNFNFYGMNEVRRAALFTAAFELIEHYAFPTISGGKIMTVKPAGAATRPGGGGGPAPDPTDTTIDTVVVSGPSVADTDQTGTDTYTFNVVALGDAAPFTYQWSVTGGTITAGATAASCDVYFTAAGPSTVKCVVSGTDGDWDGNTAEDTKSVTVSEGIGDKILNADVSVTVTVQEVSGEDKYFIDGVQQDAIAVTAGQSIYFDTSDSSMSSHPLRIYTDDSKVQEVTTGVTVAADGVLYETLVAATASYQCSAHADMGGDLTIS